MIDGVRAAGFRPARPARSTTGSTTGSATGIVASIASPLLALLASQHHLLHMLVIGAAMGGAGMSFMAAYHSLRRAMLVISLSAATFGVYRVWRRPGGFAARLMAGLSFALTAVLVTWSVAQFGP